MGVPACSERGGIVRCGAQHPVRFEHGLLRTLGGTIEQAGIGCQRTCQPASCGRQVRIDLQRLPVQRDGARVVAGLADAGVVVGTLQQRVGRGARRGGGPGHDGHGRGDHHRTGGNGGYAPPPAPSHGRCLVCGCGLRDRLHGRAELVATAADRAHIARAAAVIAQRLAQQLHPLADRIFADHRRGPHLRGEGIEAHHVGTVRQQAIEQPPTQSADRQNGIAAPHLLHGAVDVQVQQAHGLHAVKHRARRNRPAGGVGLPPCSPPSLTVHCRQQG